MSHESKAFDAIPAGACTLVVGAFELGDNGENAKSAPLKLVARSGKPIEHWFWGRVVHDLAGMSLHKSRLAVDYVHDPKEIIGYLNKFDTSSGDLVTSGALVPFKDTDRATEIVHKMGEGVPYEASINFGGDGIKVQEVRRDEVAPVNGYDFEGPGIIIREWPLRGVAVCPYGADMNTESAAALSNSKQVFSASVVTEPEAATKEIAMSESVEVEAEVVTPEAETVEEQEAPAVEAELTEDEAAPEVDAPVESEEDEPAEEAPPEDEDDEPAAELSREEFTRIADEFGAEIATQTVRDGGDYSTALRAYADGLKADNDSLRARVEELEAAKVGGTPAKVASAKTKKKLFNTNKK